VRTKIYDDALHRERYVYGTPRNQIDSVDGQLNTIDKIWRDTTGSATQLNSIFVVVDTVQVFTRITGRYEWAGLRDVGSYPPNPYGVRDLCGNAFEWCWDASTGSETDVRGARVDYRGKSSMVRMRRGGNYLSPDRYQKSDGRDEACAVSPLSVTGFTGFRTVRRAP
jgi:formylglycine-generating enzyme required for sulfatase activity